MNATYLTTDQLSERIHYDARTIRTCLKDAVLLGVHYISPFGGRKLLLIWEAIQRNIGKFSAAKVTGGAGSVRPVRNSAIPMANGGWPMAEVRVRLDNGLLFMDFYYRGCALPRAGAAEPDRKGDQAGPLRLRGDVSGLSGQSTELSGLAGCGSAR